MKTRIINPVFTNNSQFSYSQQLILERICMKQKDTVVKNHDDYYDHMDTDDYSVNVGDDYSYV